MMNHPNNRKNIITDNNDFTYNEYHKKAEENLLKLKNELDSKSNIIDIIGCRQLLNETKILMTHFPSLSPKPKRLFIRELLIGRECSELGTLLSIRNKDSAAFERHLAQLYPYYYDYSNILPPGNREYLLGALYLIYLLSSNRLGEFHLYLQQLPIESRSNEYIMKAIDFETNFMYGNYKKIVDDLKSGNNNIFKNCSMNDFFMDNLLKSVRNKIFHSLENSCDSIDISLAAEKLFFTNIQEFKAFIDERNDAKRRELVLGASDLGSFDLNSVGFSRKNFQGCDSNLFLNDLADVQIRLCEINSDKLHFTRPFKEKNYIPVLGTVHLMINYATELERIV